MTYPSRAGDGAVPASLNPAIPPGTCPGRVGDMRDRGFFWRNDMTADITPENVAKMLDGVTPGPWHAAGPPWNQIIYSSSENRVAFTAHSNGLDDDRDLATARFIAWAREAVPALAARLAEVEAGLSEPLEHWINDAFLQRRRAEAAEAKLAALQNVVSGLVAILDRNSGKGPIPDVEMMFCWLAAQDVRATWAKIKEASK